MDNYQSSDTLHRGTSETVSDAADSPLHGIVSRIVSAQCMPTRRLFDASGPAMGIAALFCGLLAMATPARAADDLPVYLQDRGTGIPTSLVGTYTRDKELLVYMFFEYTTNSDEEYKPSDLGFGLDQDFRGKRTDREGLLFMSYGFADYLAVELESAFYTTATLHKAHDDPSAVPNRIKESGLGDTEGQIRVRWWKETENRPELFTYFEAVFPLQKDRVLIGTGDWEFAPGLGLIKGSRWGTLTGRIAGSYTTDEKKFNLGETAVEYLKRFSPRWRGALSLEGEQDEWALTAEIQLHLSPRAFIKLNNGFGLTSKAPDQAPELGIALSFE